MPMGQKGGWQWNRAADWVMKPLIPHLHKNAAAFSYVFYVTAWDGGLEEAEDYHFVSSI